MLSAAELSRMRSDAALILPDVATIYRRTLTTDGNGGKVDSYTAQTPTIDCRLSAISKRSRSTDAQRAGKVEAAEGWIVSFPIGSDVRETDRVAINGVTYQVISQADRRSYDVNLRVIVTRV